MTIEAIIDATVAKEGGYSNHPADRGGETMFGITIAVARANGYVGAMQAMPRSVALGIYRRQYYEAPGFAVVATVSPRIAEELFDTGVNMGPGVPARWLQEWLNALNDGGKLYPDIPEDGQIGGGTVAALAKLIGARGRAAAEAVILKGLNCSQGERYKQLARGRVQNEAFVFGWLANRVGLAA